jgi:hypothetical protein
MPPAFNRSFGMILLGIWLVLSGLSNILAFPLPIFVLPFLAVIAGALILLGE